MLIIDPGTISNKNKFDHVVKDSRAYQVRSISDHIMLIEGIQVNSSILTIKSGHIGSYLHMNLFDDVIQYPFSHIKRRSEKSATYFYGDFLNDNHAILVVRNNNITGSIHYHRKLYTIMPISDTKYIHLLFAVNTSALPDEKIPIEIGTATSALKSSSLSSLSFDGLFSVYEGSGRPGWLQMTQLNCAADSSWTSNVDLPNHGSTGAPGSAIYLVGLKRNIFVNCNV